MSFKEFGRVIEEAPKTQFREFGKLVDEPSRTRSLISAPVKGALKGASEFLEMFPMIPKGPIPHELGLRALEETLPTQEKEPEKYLERAGRIGTQALLSPGGAVTKGIQTLGGAALGYGLEKLGAPSWAQAIAESLPFFYSAGKKIPLKPDQKKLGEFLRKEGLTENEITPLLKTPEQIERWSKLASKGKKSRELMESVYQKTGHIYDNIDAMGSKLSNPNMNPQASTNFFTNVDKILKSMPNKYRNLVKQDLKDLKASGGSFNGLTNFYRDINAVIGGERGGKAIVGQFKGPILRAMESINPQLADDFKLATDLYRTRANVAGKLLTKKQIEEFLDLSEMFGLGVAAFNRDYGLMSKVLGVTGARQFAREMLINPRLQNKSIRVGEALKRNNLSLAEKYMNEIQKIIAEDNPELADMIPTS